MLAKVTAIKLVSKVFLTPSLSLNNLYVDVKKKKEQKQMEKEMQRLHLLSGKGAESK